MGKSQSCNYNMYVNIAWICIIVNLGNVYELMVAAHQHPELSWSKRAAIEAESVAAKSCSGHGRAYLDGLVVDDSGAPVCECNPCYEGPDCSQFIPTCSADATSGDPYFLEPFWMKKAESSAVLVSGWHRLGYTYSDGSYISKVLENEIRQLHDVVGNAVTKGRYIIYGAGSTQLLNAAVHALASQNSSSPAKVVASSPYFQLYKTQTEFFQSRDFEFAGEASMWKNKTNSTTQFIEFVTSPNNPDGKLTKAVLQGPNAKAIFDRVYYWPHYIPISAPADDDIMVFSISKLTGHAGTRFGWAVVKDEAVYERMVSYIQENTMGVSRDAQLRVFQLIKAILQGKGKGKEIFDFAYKTMSKRWERLSKTLSVTSLFSIEKMGAQYCNFFHKVRHPSPAYAWLKCEREEDKDCNAVLEAANITGRKGSAFGAEDRFARLSLIRSQDDFDLLIDRLNKLAYEESGTRFM
ncbi:Trytophan aminotransferase [Parasponia andersonii]|uniref:Trytophan aminotransferase n=1 Tax=Parasponia andersonii TaxID=3476 RepID=A0A2P5BV62_PARAD|nr:Trytophan aminotransferase [Parasponia andersonii]